MKKLILLAILTAFTIFISLTVGVKEFRTHMEPEKDLIEKATLIDGKIDTEFLESTFGPANE